MVKKIPRLVSEKIGYYLWKINVCIVNKEYKRNIMVFNYPDDWILYRHKSAIRNNEIQVPLNYRNLTSFLRKYTPWLKINRFVDNEKVNIRIPNRYEYSTLG
tara:strand:- start:3033 stop:3338 length:306 start_codon:yes stop_codon:yes gene_type:complete